MKNYPAMIYHLIDGERVVHSEEEKKRFLDAGWSDKRIPFNEVNAIKAKIASHEAEIRKLEINLVAAEQQERIARLSIGAPVPEIQKENEEIQDEESGELVGAGTSPAVERKRGRPRKDA